MPTRSSGTIQGGWPPGVGRVDRGLGSLATWAPAEQVALSGLHKWSLEELLTSWEVIFPHLLIASLLSGGAHVILLN